MSVWTLFFFIGSFVFRRKKATPMRHVLPPLDHVCILLRSWYSNMSFAPKGTRMKIRQPVEGSTAQKPKAPKTLIY